MPHVQAARSPLAGNGAGPSMSAKTGAGLVVALALAAVLAARPAGAADESSWPRFPGSAYASQSDPTDRAFIKEWEATPPKGYPTLSPANVAATKAAIKRYTDIVAAGGWQAAARRPAAAGHRRTRPSRCCASACCMSGDLREQGGSTRLRLLRRQGGEALSGLQRPGADRHRRQAHDRGAQHPGRVAPQAAEGQPGAPDRACRKTAGKRYVVVNIPAAQIEAVESDRIVSRHAGVVGKPDRPTPILNSAIHELNFNAVWHLPPTVIEKDLIPKGQEMARRNQSVLVKFNIDAYGGDGKKLDPNKVNWSSPAAKSLTYRQQPGPENPLGFVKINFNNAHSVYMHDTPSQSLFGRNFRAASSGCVRVQGIEQLAAWILADQGWRPEHVLQMKESGERRDVTLKKPVPLYFVYITAWATEDGIVQFRRDLYQKDGIGATAAAY